MAGSMKEIKLRIRSVESTMQITKAMELVASSKLRRAKERVEGSRPYFETLYSTLYDIVSADSGFDSPYLVRRDTNRRLYIVIAGDRGLAGGYNSNILKAIEADAEGADYCVLPIGKKAVEHFERRKAAILTTAFAEAGDLSVSDCFEISRLVCQKCTRKLSIHFVFTVGKRCIFTFCQIASDFISQCLKHRIQFIAQDWTGLDNFFDCYLQLF